jgi:hypothetical protein
MISTDKKLGEILLEQGVINSLQQSAAIGEQKRWGGKFGSILIQMGFVDEEKVASILEKKYNQKCISLKDREIPLNIISIIKPDVAKKYKVVPLGIEKRSLLIATSEPNNLSKLDDLAFIIGMNVKPVLAVEYDIQKAINRYYG